jgi:nitrate reductase alpha subunit
MSHFLDRLTFFKRATEPFSNGHGITTTEDRGWEDGYRKRWQHDKVVRSTAPTAPAPAAGRSM